MLVRCAYASRAKAGSDDMTVQAILDKCRTKNPERGITGFLCVADGVYVQVLEGGRDEICELLFEIIADERHEQLRLLAYEEIDVRKYASWTMGQIDLRKVNARLVLKYFEKPALDPFSAPGRSTLAFLDELASTSGMLGRG